MAGPGNPGDLKDRLQSLRLEREPAARQPSRARLVIVVSAVAVTLAGGSILAWRRFVAAPLVVDVVYARSVAAGKPVEGEALSGAGYAITAEKYIAIGVRVPGRIERYLVDEGDRVEAGQPLVELDARDYRAQVGRAKASLRLSRAQRDLARLQLDRVRKLFAEGVSSKEELDQAVSRHAVTDAEVARAENELAQTRVNLDDTVLRSPVRGVVLAKLKAVGEVAVPGGFAGAGDLLRIADLTELRAEVDIAEADLSQVTLGQTADVVPDAYPGRRYEATVVKLYPQVNRQKGTRKVEVRIAGPDEYLLPDMSVRVTFRAAAAKGEARTDATVLVPRQATRRDGEGAYVWLLTDGTLRRRAIEVGAEVGQEAQVVRGLDGGEAIVIGSEDGLREGAPAGKRR